MMSTELAFEDFMRGLSPIRVQLDRIHIPSEVVRAREYQAQSDDLLAALRSGSSVRLEASLWSLGMAA